MLPTHGSTADRKAPAELRADAYLIKSDIEGSKLLDTRFWIHQPETMKAVIR